MPVTERTSTRIARLATAARVSKRLATDDREARDRAMLEGDDEGLSLHELHRLTGLGVSQVQRIVAAQTARRQKELAERVP